MILFAGLGNPGAKYAGNRHNIGFMAVDQIARCHKFPAWRSRFRGQVTEGRLSGEKVLLLKPQTFMNDSGFSIRDAMGFFKLEADEVYVFHDELDLAPGKIRCKLGGGLAGHNGLRSIASQIGPEFNRVRLGIGHPGNKNRVHSWVLKDFAKADQDWVEPMIQAIGENADLLAKGEASSFQNKVHLAMFPDAGEKPSGQPGVRGANTTRTAVPDPDEKKSGPLADALRKLLSTKQDS